MGVKYSVIVPIYNVEDYLESCIESILNQKRNDIELILIDDGSTDNSGNIADSYSNSFTTVIHHSENRGLGAARNTGLECASGEWICFVDSDDMISDNYFSVLDIMTDFGNDVCQIDFLRFKDNIDIKCRPYRIYTLKASNLSRKYHMAWCNIVRRELFENVRFPDRLVHEDSATMPVFGMMTEVMTVTDEPLYYYRDRNESLENNKTIESELGLIDCYEWLYNLANNNNRGFDVNNITLKYCARFFYDVMKKRLTNLNDESLDEHLELARMKFGLNK